MKNKPDRAKVCQCCESCKNPEPNDHHCQFCPLGKSEVSDEVFTYFGKNDSYWRELEDGTIQKFDKENGWITWKPETDCIPKKELAEMLREEDETGSMNDDGEYYYDPLSKARNDLRKELKDKFNL